MVLAMAGQGDRRQRLPETLFSLSSLPWVRGAEGIASFPGLHPFLSSVCIHNNAREQKTGKKQGRPESVHHTSGCKVDRGGKRPICRY